MDPFSISIGIIIGIFIGSFIGATRVTKVFKEAAKKGSITVDNVTYQIRPAANDSRSAFENEIKTAVMLMVSDGDLDGEIFKALVRIKTRTGGRR